MKLQNSKITFLLILFEVYGVFSAAFEPTLVSTSDFQECLTKGQSLQKGEQSPHRSFSFKLNPFLNLNCRHPWVLVGRTCLFIDLSKDTSWMEGRNFCKLLHKGSDLAVFRDANEFAEIIRHLRTINSSNKDIHFWIGGSDLEQHDNWRWITGEPMPMGAPFWAPGEPNLKNEQCAMFFKNSGYYLGDYKCEGGSLHMSSICQYNPFQG